MSLKLPSFSKLELAEHCTYAWTSGDRWDYDRSSTFAKVGKAVSRFAEVYAIFGSAPLDDIAEELSLDKAERKTFERFAGFVASMLDDELAEDVHRSTETGYAYNVDTGGARILPKRHERDYGAGDPGEMWGSSDLDRITKSGRLIIRDWKTGAGIAGKSPRTLPQLRALALAGSIVHGVDQVTVEIVQIDDRGPFKKAYTFGPFELSEIAAGLRTMRNKIAAGGTDVPQPGYWCKRCYCPIRATCPATLRALEVVDRATDPKFRLLGEIESPEHAAYIRERVAVLEAVIEDRKGAVNAFATKEPIPAPGGKVYGLREKTSRSIDMNVPGAIEALAPLGTHADAAMQVSITLTALHDAARAAAPKGQAAELERQVIDRLYTAGAYKESKFTKLEEFKPSV